MNIIYFIIPTILLIYYQPCCNAFNINYYSSHCRQWNWFTKAIHHNSNDNMMKDNNNSRAWMFQLQASKRSGAMSRKKGNNNSSSNNNKSGGGFGTQVNNNNNTNNKNEKIITSGVIYSRPALYDLAFGYRNYEEEVKFLLDVHDEYTLGDNIDGNDSSNSISRHIIELAAGPARHSITSLRNYPTLVSSCTAIDLSQEMMEYSKEVADEELGDVGLGGIRDRFHYIQADMRSFGNDHNNELMVKPNSYDSAWILLGSMQHLTTNDDVIACFKSANHALRQGGTMVIELPHPRETFTMVECTRNSWEVPLEDDSGNEYGELKVIWGDDDDKFDPIRQVRDFTVAMDLKVDDENDVDDSDLQSVKEVVPMRLFTFQEIDALGRLSGFDVVQLYGALSNDFIDVNNEDEAFRLICVLRKT